ISCHYYIRFMVEDCPGVLAQISTVLGESNISIRSMVQPEQQLGGCVPIVMLTHGAKECDIQHALDEIDALDSIKEQSLFIRMENDLA
ncbi:MAG: ACT domain-containing protein, partial [Deltaproteobacteria bacterium]|nr:ACT domain-containing protein [Deltaproteobacteria bacterium]